MACSTVPERAGRMPVAPCDRAAAPSAAPARPGTSCWRRPAAARRWSAGRRRSRAVAGCRARDLGNLGRVGGGDADPKLLREHRQPDRQPADDAERQPQRDLAKVHRARRDRAGRAGRPPRRAPRRRWPMPSRRGTRAAPPRRRLLGAGRIERRVPCPAGATRPSTITTDPTATNESVIAREQRAAAVAEPGQAGHQPAAGERSGSRADSSLGHVGDHRRGAPPSS